MNPPEKPLCFSLVNDPNFGEIYIVSNPRTGTVGYDLFVPQNSLEEVSALLLKTACPFAGWLALEARRIELGIPRFGADMDEATLPPEAHLEKRAISYTKGCYIGQEVIARLRNYGQAAKTLRGLLLPDSVRIPPVHGDKITHGEKEVGFVTSATLSPRLGRWIGLGYVRREIISQEIELCLRQETGDLIPLQLAELPFA